METTIYLVRHAQTDSNAGGRFQGWSDIELNECGYAQTEQVADRLMGKKIDAVYSSPLKRSLVTATAIAGRHALTPLILPELAEINYGEWEGKSRAEVQAKWPELLCKMRNEPGGVIIPGGESFEGFCARSLSAFNQIAAREEGKRVVVIAHSGVIKALILRILGAESNVWGKFDIENTSITTVKVIDGIPRLVSINNTSHLAGNEKTLKENPAIKLIIA